MRESIREALHLNNAMIGVSYSCGNDETRKVYVPTMTVWIAEAAAVVGEAAAIGVEDDLTAAGVS